MELEISITDGPNKGRTFALPAGANLMFGKSKAVQCQIDDPDVALAHFEVRVEDGKIWLADCGSRAGTMVNGRGATEMELQAGDKIKIGNTQLCLQEAGIPGLKKPGTTMGGAAAKSKLDDLEGKTIAHYEVIKKIAAVGENSLRNRDMMGRIGGEEFLCVLPRTTAEQSLQVAQRLLEAISEHVFTTPDGRSFSTSISIGIANFDTSISNADQLYARADEAMYQSKAAGKGRITAYQAP